MKNLSLGAHASLLIAIFFTLLMVLVTPHHYISARFQREGAYSRAHEDHDAYPKEGKKEEVGTELYPTGSSLPDCSHACGPCFPCKRVMVSFKCSIAESCPIVYRCMCKGKYYHVPSN